MARNVCYVEGCGKFVHGRGLCDLHYQRIKLKSPLSLTAPGFVWKPLAQRFEEGIEYDPNGGCWLWSGAVNQCGYGRIGLERGRGTVELTHRLAWQMFRGEIGNLHVCHRCDNPPCCNPEHLFLGTAADNAADKVQKGRQTRGESAWKAKLKAVEIPEIRRRAASGESDPSIASAYGVTKAAIAMIRTGKNWKHVK